MMQQSAEVTFPQKILSEHTDSEDDQAGPVFVKIPDQMGWIKVNNFSACDQCRTSHVKCSLSVTGGPCSHCKNRNQLCKVYGWVFNPECPAYHIYKPVLPPPPVAPSSPLFSCKMYEYEFQWELLVQRLSWLQREAPRKFRKRSSAMPWKDEPNVIASDQSRKRLQNQQMQSPGAQCLDETSQGVSSGELVKRRRAPRGGDIVNCKYDCKDEEPALPIAQHRMSISFILSPCNSEKPSKPSKKNEGSAVSSNGWESRRTSLASSEAGWSTRSGTRSPSLPAIDSLPKAMKSSNISFHSPPAPPQIDRHEIISKFIEWRPPCDSPAISAKNCTFSTIPRF